MLGLTATPVSKATLAGTYAGLQELASNLHATYLALDEADSELLVRCSRSSLAGPLAQT